MHQWHSLLKHTERSVLQLLAHYCKAFGEEDINSETML